MYSQLILLQKNYQVDVSENEIGYIALHFALAIERYQKQGPKKNILFVQVGWGVHKILFI